MSESGMPVATHAGVPPAPEHYLTYEGKRYRRLKTGELIKKSDLAHSKSFRDDQFDNHVPTIAAGSKVEERDGNWYYREEEKPVWRPKFGKRFFRVKDPTNVAICTILEDGKTWWLLDERGQRAEYVSWFDAASGDPFYEVSRGDAAQHILMTTKEPVDLTV